MFDIFKNMKINVRVYILLFIVVLITVVFAIIGMLGMKTIQNSLLTVYYDRVLCLKQLKTISDTYAINILNTGNKIHDGEMTYDAAITNITEAQALIHKEWNDYLDTSFVEQEKIIVKDLTPLIAEGDNFSLKIISQMKNNQAVDLRYTIDNYMNPTIAPILKKLNLLVDVQVSESENVVRATEKLYDKGFIISFAFGIFLILILVILVRDVTFRKKVEDALISSENRYRLLVESSPICIHEIDLIGKITSMNYAGLLMMGVKEECDVQGLLYLDAVSAPDRERIADLLKRAYAGETSNFEFKSSGPKGQIFKSCFAPIKNENGDIKKLMGITEDITERKKSEEALLALKNDLENRVIKRTKEIEAINLDLESFSYSISHDLRAPLRAIGGFSAILQEDYAPKLDKEGLRLFQVVIDNAQKMEKLIDDILSFSRAGRHEITLTVIDMNALVQQVWRELESQRTGRVIEFRIANLPPAGADPSALHQVWQNLLSNAIKFTHDVEKSIIEVEGHREGNRNIYIVKDNGVGFDMAYVHKLFGLFQRLHGMNEFEGTGVGLSIVKRFISKHGGEVWAEGKVGQGAAFYFSIPIKEY